MGNEQGTVAGQRQEANQNTASPSVSAQKPEGMRADIMKGGMLLYGRQIISIGLKMIGVLLISRVLGPELYGAYTAAFGVYSYVLALGQAGLGIFLLRHEGPLTQGHIGTAYTLLAAMAALLVVGIELLLTPLSHYMNVAGFTEVMQVLILAIPFQLVAIPVTAQLERALNYRAVAFIEVIGQVAYYVVAVALVLGGAGPIGLAFSWIIQQVVSALLAHLLGRHWPKFQFDRSVAGDMLSYSIAFSAANWIWQARMLVNPLIVGPALGAYAVGIVGMTVGIMEMLGVIKTITWRLSVAVLAKFQDDRARICKAITEGMQIQILAIGTLMLGFSWFGQWIIPLVFGARWLPILELYPFVALSYLTNAPFNMHSAVLSVLRRNGRLALFHSLHIVLFAGAAAIAVPLFGIKGYGYAELVALPAYLLAHYFIIEMVGAPNYGLAILWWSGTAIGLFWKELGLWAIGVPFLALLAPPSLAVLKGYFSGLRGRLLPVQET